MFQLHAAFAIDHVVPALNPVLVTLRGEPFASISIMKNFLIMYDANADKDIIGVFHNGAVGWMNNGDKDGYVAKVLAILSKL